MKVEVGSHCRYQIRYHIVWKVKFSRKILFGERVTYLKELIIKIGNRYDFTIEAVGIDKFHLHIFAGANPSISPAKMIQILKSITARGMFKKYPEIKRFLWGGNLWAIGYYVRTVSDGPIDSVIKQYVENQGKEHLKKGKRMYQLKLVP
jgi:putative transposase